jgi:hypothetical protein
MVLGSAIAAFGCVLTTSVGMAFVPWRNAVDRRAPHVRALSQLQLGEAERLAKFLDPKSERGHGKQGAR